MNIEEFKNKLKLQCTFGITGKTGASRRYHDKEMNIGAELHTPKDKYGQWGEGEMTYYFEDSKKEHDSIEELFKEYQEREKSKA